MRQRNIMKTVDFALFLLLIGSLPFLGLSPKDRGVVTKALDREAKALKEEGRELRGARRLKELRFSSADKPDVFAFVTLENVGGGNNYATQKARRS
jgi:hypothetical protein